MSAGHEFTQAVVLGAGLGTRLRPMTHHLPKPGVPLAHVPVAAHTIAHLLASGVRDIAVNTHYLAEDLEAVLPQHVPEGLSLRFSRETELLGTGGGIRAAWALLDPSRPLVVMNGDILFRPDLRAAMALHQERRALATMIVRQHPEAERLGAIETDAQGRVVRLLGAPAHHVPQDVWMFTGVHLLSPAVFHELPLEGCIVRQAYRHWVDAERPVFAVESSASFRDIGTHAEYLAAHLDALDAESVLHAVDPTARLGTGVVVTRSWIGAGADLAAGVHLHECVVWPGAHVTESATRTIFGPFGVIRVD